MTEITSIPDIAALKDGDRVRLYPTDDNPIHKEPVVATYSAGYFYCDGSNHLDGPDYYFADVFEYNEKVELINE